jgi:hypothetical protein
MKKILSIKAILLVIIFSIVGTIGIISIFFITNFNQNTSAVITACLLYLTFVVVIWYSWETRQLKIETRRLRKWASADHEISKKQSITDIRPYLRLQMTNTTTFLQLVNEGKGVAVNLEPIYIKGKIRKPLLRIPAMAAAPNSNTINFVPYELARSVNLDPEIAYYMILVNYEDIEGRKYEAIFQSDKDYNDKFSIISQDEVKNRG